MVQVASRLRFLKDECDTLVWHELYAKGETFVWNQLYAERETNGRLNEEHKEAAAAAAVSQRSDGKDRSACVPEDPFETPDKLFSLWSPTSSDKERQRHAYFPRAAYGENMPELPRSPFTPPMSHIKRSDAASAGYLQQLWLEEYRLEDTKKKLFLRSKGEILELVKEMWLCPHSRHKTLNSFLTADDSHFLFRCTCGQCEEDTQLVTALANAFEHNRGEKFSNAVIDMLDFVENPTSNILKWQVCRYPQCDHFVMLMMGLESFDDAVVVRVEEGYEMERVYLKGMKLLEQIEGLDDEESSLAEKVEDLEEFVRAAMQAL